MEQWKQIHGYEEYEVSNIGNVKRGGKKLKLSNKGGIEDNYKFVTLCGNKKRKKFLVHRLAAQAFIPNPENKTQVNHINGIKNDNRIENLEWCSPRENILHKYNVLGYRHSEETKNKMSISATKRNKNNQFGNKKVKINGIEFDSLEKASLSHNKHRKYFTQLIYKSKKQNKENKKWKIELI